MLWISSSCCISLSSVQHETNAALNRSLDRHSKQALYTQYTNHGGSVAEWLGAGLRRRRTWVQIAAATLLGNNLRQTVHTQASVPQAAKLVAALLRIAG